MIANLVVRRIGLGIITIWVMSALVFFGIEILPGDVADAILGQGATEETLHAIREELGLYRPAYVRYLDWLGGLLRGEVGEALGTGRSIAEMKGEDARRRGAVPLPAISVGAPARAARAPPRHACGVARFGSGPPACRRSRLSAKSIGGSGLRPATTNRRRRALDALTGW